MSSWDSAINNSIPMPSTAELEHLWRSQWGGVPAALCDQLAIAGDIKSSAAMEFKTIGLTGAYEATRTMVYVDYVLGMSRAAFEGNQGCEDFGWNDLIPNWMPPGIFAARDGEELTRYDGISSLAHSQIIAWINSGILDHKSILNFDSDDTHFVATEEQPDRKGGFGQGAKIMLATFIATKTDRINALELYMDKNKKSLDSNDRDKIRAAISKLKDSLEAEGENDTFATVQAKGSDGIYRRTYCYRRPYQSGGKELWGLNYIVVELEAEKIPEAERDKVIFAVHYPDIPLTESLDAMKENMLETNPYYPSKHSLVRSSDSDLPSATITKTKGSLSFDSSSDNDFGFGEYTVERIDMTECQPERPPVSGKIYFRETRMIPSEKPDMGLIFDYNITRLDELAKTRIARSSNSTYVTGPIGEIVSQSVSRINKPLDWLKIIDLAQVVTTNNLDQYLFPELTPKSISKSKNNKSVYESLINAFNLKYPTANNKVARCQADVDAYREFTGDLTPIPIISSTKFVDFLSEAGITDIKTTNDEYIEKKLLIKHKTGKSEIISSENVNNGIRNGEEYKSIMAEGPIDAATFIKLAFSQNDIFYFSNSAKTYGIDATQGKHAIIFQMYNGTGINDLIYQLSLVNKFNDNPRALAILLAAIDSGIDIRFETNSRSEKSYTTQIEITPGGNLAVFSGEMLRSNSDWSSGKIIIGGKVSDLLEIQNELDSTIGKKHPEILEARDENEFTSTLRIINRTLSLLAPGQKINEITIDNITQILTTAMEAQARINSTLDKLNGERKKITQNNGQINGATITGSFPGGGKVSSLYREGVMLARSSRSSLQMLSRNSREMNQSHESGEGESFGGNDFKCVLYGNLRHSDLYPMESYETFDYVEGGIRRTNEINNLIIAENPDDGPWRYYYPSVGPGYLNRLSGDSALYDGFFEFKRDLMPVSYEAVLPVDVSKFEIAYIQFPTEMGIEAPIPPVLMYDTVNCQYSLQFSTEETDDVLKTLPAGSRIYFRVRTPESISAQIPAERDLIDNHPEYYRKITTSMISIDDLDSEARVFVETLSTRKPPLNREQSIEAIYRFWEKRRLYDDEGVVCDSVENLIRLGIGVCNESEGPMTQIPRLLSIPTRTRIAYSDQDRVGNLSPPFHVITEYLDDNGNWKTRDPPNRRSTNNYKRKLASQAINGTVPEIIDSNSLGRGGINKNIELPPDISSALDNVTLNTGENISDGVVAILNAKMRGEKVNASMLVDQLSKNERIDKELVFQTDAKEVGRVLELMQSSNIKLMRLQKRYGVDSAKVQEYRKKIALQLANLLVNAVRQKI